MQRYFVALNELKVALELPEGCVLGGTSNKKSCTVNIIFPIRTELNCTYVKCGKYIVLL